MVQPIRLADFRPLLELSEDARCMICFDAPQKPVFHQAGLATKVHHIACLGCIKQWAIANEQAFSEAGCPLCKLPLSERFLVRLCSIFSENQIKERGDLWQRQYIALIQNLASSEPGMFSLENWLEEAKQVEEELKCFLLTLRHFFAKHITQGQAVKHLLISVDNFRLSILMMKSLNHFEDLRFLALLFPFHFVEPESSTDNFSLMSATIERLAEYVLEAKQQMIKDRKDYIQFSLSFHKIALITSGITCGLFWTGFSFAESEQDPQRSFSQTALSFNLVKLSLTALSSVAAYVKVRFETDHVSQERLLKKIEHLSLDEH